MFIIETGSLWIHSYKWICFSSSQLDQLFQRVSQREHLSPENLLKPCSEKLLPT